MVRPSAEPDPQLPHSGRDNHQHQKHAPTERIAPEYCDNFAVHTGSRLQPLLSRTYAWWWMRLTGQTQPDPRIRNQRPSPHLYQMVKMFEFCFPIAGKQVPAGAHDLDDDGHGHAASLDRPEFGDGIAG
jgi:hypothetical protein